MEEVVASVTFATPSPVLPKQVTFKQAYDELLFEVGVHKNQVISIHSTDPDDLHTLAGLVSQEGRVDSDIPPNFRLEQDNHENVVIYHKEARQQGLLIKKHLLEDRKWTWVTTQLTDGFETWYFKRQDSDTMLT